MNKARIYKPAKTAMQSGKGNTEKWILDYYPTNDRFIEPVMGWTGSSNTEMSEIRLYFDTQEGAIEYAQSKGLEYDVILPKKGKTHIKLYSDNYK